MGRGWIRQKDFPSQEEQNGHRQTEGHSKAGGRHSFPHQNRPRKRLRFHEGRRTRRGPRRHGLRELRQGSPRKTEERPGSRHRLRVPEVRSVQPDVILTWNPQEIHAAGVYFTAASARAPSPQPAVILLKSTSSQSHLKFSSALTRSCQMMSS